MLGKLLVVISFSAVDWLSWVVKFDFGDLLCVCGWDFVGLGGILAVISFSGVAWLLLVIKF